MPHPISPISAQRLTLMVPTSQCSAHGHRASLLTSMLELCLDLNSLGSWSKSQRKPVLEQWTEKTGTQVLSAGLAIIKSLWVV